MNAKNRKEWIPWYCEDAASWLDLSLAARGCAEGIARKMGKDRDELDLGSRGLKALSRLLGRPWEEIAPAIAELLAPGPEGEPPRLVFDAERNVLCDPQAADRRRPVSTPRVNKHRGRVANDVVDETHETVSPVSVMGETPPRVSSPLLSSTLISDPDLPARAQKVPVWHLDSKLPDNWREDAKAQVEPSGATVDVPAQWRLYLADRMRPEQPKLIGLADWRGWVLKAIGFAAKDRGKARAGPEAGRSSGGASAAGRRAFTPKPTGTGS